MMEKFLALGVVALLVTASATAAPAYHPPGTNLVYGDVTSASHVLPTSENPAAPAARKRAAGDDKPVRGTAPSAGAGLEYGNIEELFDFYDRVSQAYAPSDPGTGGGPGQDPGDKPDGGINIGDVLDTLDPEFREMLDALAQEVATQAALLAVIATEGYGKAWLAGDIPLALGNDFLGGTLTLGLSWSGGSKAFGIAAPIDFDRQAAFEAIQNWVNTPVPARQPQIAISDDITLTPDLVNEAVLFALNNDSSLVSKSTRSTELKFGYSREAWSGDTGQLFLGANARLLFMQLSRLSVRFGDITDSEELFDSIRNADFRTDNGISLDVGALWVGENYQLGLQAININEPEFIFPDVNLEPYRDDGVIGFLLADKKYTMDRQVKLEGSIFTPNRRWAAHLGVDAMPATDPLGDDFQWLSVSAGLTMDNWWLPGVRAGYRRNLAGTELDYVGIGITAFKYVNIDVASALDSVKINGRNLPQGLMASIGFQIAW